MKAALRKEMLKKRRSLGKKECLEKSKKIAERVLSMDEAKKAEHVSCYAGTGSEVKTLGLISGLLGMGKKVLVPVVCGKEMKMSSLLSLDELTEKNRFFEPKRECLRLTSPKKIDLVIVPGTCFDCSGNRLGYGKGYYDRFLAGVNAPAIGLAFECQLAESVPFEEHDARMRFIATEKRLIECQP